MLFLILLLCGVPILLSCCITFLVFLLACIVQTIIITLIDPYYDDLIPFPAIAIRWLYRKITNKHPLDTKGYLRFNVFLKFYRIAPDNWRIGGEYIYSPELVAYLPTHQDFRIDPRDQKQFEKFKKNQEETAAQKENVKEMLKLLKAIQKDINNYDKQYMLEMREKINNISPAPIPTQKIYPKE